MEKMFGQGFAPTRMRPRGRPGINLAKSFFGEIFPCHLDENCPRRPRRTAWAARNPHPNLKGDNMTDDTYQEGWPQDRVALPDSSSNWSFTKAFQDIANTPPAIVTPQNSSLNALFDKHEIQDMLGGGSRMPGQGPQPSAGGLLSGVPQPDYSVGPIEVSPIQFPDRLETDQA